MKDFLSEYYKTNESDPSIQDIAIQFPEIIGDKPPETLYDKIRLGMISENDLKDVTYYNIPDDLYNVIVQQNVTIFKILYGNECIKKYIYSFKTLILFEIIKYCNEDLFLYLRTNRIFGDEISYDNGKTYIALITNNHIRAFMIKHFIYTREQINDNKQKCLDNLHMDAYIDFDRL